MGGDLNLLWGRMPVVADEDAKTEASVWTQTGASSLAQAQNGNMKTRKKQQKRTCRRSRNDDGIPQGFQSPIVQGVGLLLFVLVALKVSGRVGHSWRRQVCSVSETKGRLTRASDFGRRCHEAEAKKDGGRVSETVGDWLLFDRRIVSVSCSQSASRLKYGREWPSDGTNGKFAVLCLAP